MSILDNPLKDVFYFMSVSFGYYKYQLVSSDMEKAQNSGNISSNLMEYLIYNEIVKAPKWVNQLMFISIDYLTKEELPEKIDKKYIIVPYLKDASNNWSLYIFDSVHSNNYSNEFKNYIISFIQKTDFNLNEIMLIQGPSKNISSMQIPKNENAANNCLCFIKEILNYYKGIDTYIKMKFIDREIYSRRGVKSFVIDSNFIMTYETKRKELITPNDNSLSTSQLSNNSIFKVIKDNNTSGAKLNKNPPRFSSSSQSLREMKFDHSFDAKINISKDISSIKADDSCDIDLKHNTSGFFNTHTTVSGTKLGKQEYHKRNDSYSALLGVLQSNEKNNKTGSFIEKLTNEIGSNRRSEKRLTDSLSFKSPAFKTALSMRNFNNSINNSITNEIEGPSLHFDENKKKLDFYSNRCKSNNLLTPLKNDNVTKDISDFDIEKDSNKISPIRPNVVDMKIQDNVFNNDIDLSTPVKTKEDAILKESNQVNKDEFIKPQQDIDKKQLKEQTQPIEQQIPLLVKDEITNNTKEPSQSIEPQIPLLVNDQTKKIRKPTNEIIERLDNSSEDKESDVKNSFDSFNNLNIFHTISLSKKSQSESKSVSQSTLPELKRKYKPETIIKRPILKKPDKNRCKLLRPLREEKEAMKVSLEQYILKENKTASSESKDNCLIY